MEFHNGPDAVALYIAMLVFGVFVLLVVVVIKAVIFCKIFSKAGYSWALG
jgi:hypothetical protein